MGPAGFVAVIAGWVTTEVGRQPWMIYGLLRTADARLADRDARRSPASLVAFVIVYFAVFGVGAWYILRLMAKRAARAARADSATRRSAPRASRPPRDGRRGMSARFDLTIVWAVIIAFAVRCTS